MARRGQHPVLYELLGAGSATAAQGARPVQHGESAPTGIARQSIRVPIGWFWLSAVVALTLMAVAYQFGRKNGEQSGFARAQELSTDQATQLRVAGDVKDPARPTTAESAKPPGPARTGTAPKGSGVPPRLEPPAETARNGDPRVKGRNYLVIARPGADDAETLAAFLRSNGLEVAVVSDDNARFRKVIALPGFAAGTGPSSDSMRQLLAKVKSIGQSWKNAARGNRDFDDAYPELYR